MNFVSKGILASVCLTGSMTIDQGPESVAGDPTLSWFEHQLSFGLNTAYADETEDEDEDEDPREKERAQCHQNANEALNQCYADAEKISFLLRNTFRKQCVNQFALATTQCGMI